MPSAIVVDYMLGEDRATALLTRVRAKSPSRGAQPVVLVSGHMDASAAAAALDVPFLRKPFSIDALLPFLLRAA